jgi:arabinofuranosyltransferase
MLRYKVAPHLPLAVRWYGLAWDGLQDFLIGHFVGSRHQGHKVFCQFQYERFPTREEGLKIDGGEFPVFEHISVGVPGWVLPKVAIIDKLGLNDAVVARSKAARSSQIHRMMAHDRKPPRGYVQCFRPNVEIDDQGHVVVRERRIRLTADDIRACETKFMERVEKTHI